MPQVDIPGDAQGPLDGAWCGLLDGFYGYAGPNQRKLESTTFVQCISCSYLKLCIYTQYISFYFLMMFLDDSSGFNFTSVHLYRCLVWGKQPDFVCLPFPDDPCMVYLPTLKPHQWPSCVGQYTSTMEHLGLIHHEALEVDPRPIDGGFLWR